MANIEADLKIVQRKRMVIIIDECHRSTFGDMLVDIKNTFKNALIFGFTGTPIQDLNAKKDSTTPTIFGDEIHRYTLGDGIRDKNVSWAGLNKSSSGMTTSRWNSSPD